MTAKTEWPSSLDDNELDELDRYLRAHTGEGDLLLDGVHGLLSALAVGPLLVLPDEWLHEVLHEPFVDEEEGNRVLALLAKLNDSISVELDVEAYEPILGEIELEDGNAALSAQGWCEGFSRGVDLRARLWETRLGADSQLTEVLGPIMALAVDEGIFATDAEFSPLSDEEYDECLSQLPASVGAVAQYWRELPPTPDELSQPTSDSDASNPRRRRGGRSVH